MSELLYPRWPAPERVRAFMTTRAMGDVREAAVKEKLMQHLPGPAHWLRQVHGTRVIDLDRESEREADAAISRAARTVCVVQAADCMPVLLVDAQAEVVGVAHAGWRGLAGGVIEATVGAMGLAGERLIAWTGPAISARAYEVGDDVRAALLAHDPKAEVAFSPTRPGHWLADLYALARRRLHRLGIARVFGGEHCTYSEPERFFSYRRERTASRMAAFLWID